MVWPLPSLLALFVALALFDILPLLPGWLHAGLLLAFVTAGLALSLRLRHLAWPNLAEAQRRIEQDSGLPHRPLQTLADDLAAGIDDPVSRALWRVQRRRLESLLERLTLRPPSPGLARHDPCGLRFAPLLLLAIALSGGWHDGSDRLWRAVQPKLIGFGGPPVVLQVWVTPPAYTGLAPTLLESLPAGRRLAVPVGSKLLAELQGGHGLAQLAIDDEVVPFKPLDADSQRLETAIGKGRRLLVRQGHRRIDAWDIEVLPNRPPTIAIASPPRADAEGRLRLDIEARDDYGIATATAVIRRVDGPTAAPLPVNLPMGGAHPTEVHQAAWHDLTGHPWAGLPVTIQPMADSVSGQSATGEAVTTTLPERHFTNPVARAVIEQRRHLVADPAQREPVIERLAGIASLPDSYGDDLVVFLALSTARSRLMRDSSPEAVPSVLDMLWQTALRLEEGDRPAAQRTLDEAARRLEQALAEGAPQAEVERLMTELQAAVAQYLDALVDQAKRQGLAAMPTDPDQRIVSDEELQAMLDQMRDLSRTGSNQAAQQMLSDLRQLLDGLKGGLAGAPSAEQARQGRQAMNDLQAIARDQRTLLDDTFRRNQQMAGAGSPDGKLPSMGRGKPAGPPNTASANSSGRQAAVNQEALRKRLGQVLQSLGDLGADIPDSLGQAEQAMRELSQALRQGNLDDAVDAQSEAVARLEEGAKQAAQALANQSGPGGIAQGPGSGRDPLGRPLNGPGSMDENVVKIPDKADTQKAREVLDELRRRSGQAERPPVEREYLQRLLKQFN